MELPNNQTYALPQGHYVADGGAVAVLAKILQTGQSVNDFGVLSLLRFVKAEVGARWGMRQSLLRGLPVGDRDESSLGARG